MDAWKEQKLFLEKVKETIQNLLFSAAIGVILLLVVIPDNIKYFLLYVGAIIFFANIINTFVADWRPKERMPAEGKSVIISGCDTGFGHLLALKLDKIGFQVFAGCLFPKSEGAKMLKENSSNKLHIVPMDVCKDEDMENAMSYVMDNLKTNKLWAVVCNAGINDGGEVNWTDVNTIKKIVEVNTFGVIRLTKAFLPEICKSKGRIVIVSSAAGKMIYPGMVPYALSKSAAITFCDGLRLEMGYRFGIEVIAILPWWYKTNITEENKIMSYITRMWEQAPNIIKDMYPVGFINLYIAGARKNLQFVSRNENCSEVVDCMEEAITSKRPKYTYCPGAIGLKTSYWFLSRLPKQIADFLVLYTYTLFYDIAKKKEKLHMSK